MLTTNLSTTVEITLYLQTTKISNFSIITSTTVEITLYLQTGCSCSPPFHLQQQKLLYIYRPYHHKHFQFPIYNSRNYFISIDVVTQGMVSSHLQQQKLLYIYRHWNDLSRNIKNLQQQKLLYIYRRPPYKLAKLSIYNSRNYFISIDFNKEKAMDVVSTTVEITLYLQTLNVRQSTIESTTVEITLYLQTTYRPDYDA